MSQMIESFMNQGSAFAQALELPEAGDGPPAAPLVLREPHPLHAVKVRLQVRVGEAQMTVGELLGARESEVLVLDRALEQPVDLLLEGKVVARGQLVAVDGAFAVRITELPLPLKLT
jgi:flagellar motor switch protein FliN/FliY